jgi:predicted RecA/RadA family phage recombinase
VRRASSGASKNDDARKHQAPRAKKSLAECSIRGQDETSSPKTEISASGARRAVLRPLGGSNLSRGTRHLPVPHKAERRAGRRSAAAGGAVEDDASLDARRRRAAAVSAAMAAQEPTDDRRRSSQGAGFSDISAVASPGASLGAPGALPTVRTGAQGVVSSPLASASTLAIGSSSGAADLSGIFAACREATHELDLGARAAVSHREKCAVVLGAAVAVNIALAEADAVHTALDPHVQTQLKRLAVGVLSVLGLAVARVQVYGQFSRAQKAARIFRYAATASKFDELRLDLEALEGQLWNLTGAVGGLGAGGTTGGGGANTVISVKTNEMFAKSVPRGEATRGGKTTREKSSRLGSREASSGTRRKGSNSIRSTGRPSKRLRKARRACVS